MRYLLHDVFTESVRKNPENIAIVTEAGDSVSYNSLNALSNQFANLLQSIKSSTREHPYVGIIAPVHPHSIACILGTLKLGCTYVPLDEHSPTERLAHIVNNTQLDSIAVDTQYYKKHTELFKLSEIQHIILLDANNAVGNAHKIIPFSKVLQQPTTEPPQLNQVSDDLAYILHSSGSTGIPKGIMLTHRNARTFVDWMHKEFNVHQSDRILSRAPFKFDLSVFDVFNTFKAGATLICFDWNKKRDNHTKHSDYVTLMEKERATILYTTPSTFICLLNRGGLQKANLNLREVMYAGEPFPVPQLRRLQQALPNTKIANIYGPSETNIITYFWIGDIPEDSSSIPLGAVVEDTEILVVSEDQKRICKPNEVGELWCRGGTVTIGYLGMPEKTEEHLVVSPFHKYPVYFWRTGDYGYRNEKGILHYRGRKDHMVKVKGFRIEIGEVEHAISGFKGLDEFVVVAKPDKKYSNRLYCYFSVLANATISEENLKNYLKTKLPDYMIPYACIQMDVLPKTSSGKIDRVLLAKHNTLEQTQV